MKALVSDAADPQRTLPPFLHNAAGAGNRFLKKSLTNMAKTRSLGLEKCVRRSSSVPSSPSRSRAGGPHDVGEHEHDNASGPGSIRPGSTQPSPLTSAAPRWRSGPPTGKQPFAERSPSSSWSEGVPAEALGVEDLGEHATGRERREEYPGTEEASSAGRLEVQEVESGVTAVEPDHLRHERPGIGQLNVVG
jgi:hypothetical protein